jgi:hypothetical protein
MKRKGSAHLITISSQILSTLSDFITGNQVVFFFEPSVLCRDEHDLLKPRSTVLAPVASLSPETVSLVRPPTRRPRPANEEETGERRASFASSNQSRQKEKQNS